MKKIIYSLFIIAVIVSCGSNDNKKSLTKSCNYNDNQCPKKENIYKSFHSNGSVYRHYSWVEESNLYVKREWNKEGVLIWEEHAKCLTCWQDSEPNLGISLGSHKEWYRDGTLKQQYSYGEDDIIIGVWKQWHPNGELYIERTKQLVANEKGNLYGTTVGMEYRYDEEGNLTSQHSYNEKGDSEGLAISWNVIKNVRKKAHEIKWITYNGNTTKEYEKWWHYDRDLKTGNEEEGILREHVRYADADNDDKDYYVQNGKRQLWHDNAQIELEATYNSHILVGEYKEWYSDGSAKVDGNYFKYKKIDQTVQEKKDGAWKEWHKNGTLAIDAKYKKGDVVFLKQFSDQGVLVREQ